MKRLSGGIDIGKSSHHMVILDEKEDILYQRKIPHNLSKMKEIMRQLEDLAKSKKAHLSFAL